MYVIEMTNESNCCYSRNKSSGHCKVTIICTVLFAASDVPLCAVIKDNSQIRKFNYIQSILGGRNSISNKLSVNLNKRNCRVSYLVGCVLLFVSSCLLYFFFLHSARLFAFQIELNLCLTFRIGTNQITSF